MSFFEQQHRARRNTRVLVALYLLAVLGVIVAVDAVIAGSWALVRAENAAPLRTAGGALVQPGFVYFLARTPPELLLWGAAAVVLVVGGVSAWHAVRLSSGGDAVARMVGARAVAPDTPDPLERRLLNVVEEMSIAAGLRVPRVYVMDGEAGINAFAAGVEVSNAVVAVTRGALERLTRDELQGVIGHEFSHILQGDMRLNVRLIGILQGIVFIGAVGEFVMRSVGRGSGRKDGAAVAIVAGLGLFVVGAVGLFFARLIKAAVARQREFLADAASVQFTRNPEGLAGALDQIRQHAQGARISDRHAEALSHMYFGEAVKGWWLSAFSTHPPVDERIRRAAPRFEREDYRARRARAAQAMTVTDEAGAAVEPGAPAEAGPTGPQAGRWVLTQAVLASLPGGQRTGDRGTTWDRPADEGARMVGAVQPEHVDAAAALMATLPVSLRDALHASEGAGTALVAMMLAAHPEVRRDQVERLRLAGLLPLAERAVAMVPLVAALGDEHRLPLVDLALPALKTLDLHARDQLVTALEAVILADRRVTLHEFVVLTLVRDQLTPPPPRPATQRLDMLHGDVVRLLSLVCLAGRGRGDDARALSEAAFAAGMAAMGPGAGADRLDESALQLHKAGESLEALRSVAPLQKAVLVKGLFAAATHDGTIRVAEAELLRMVAAVLDCPLPPFVAPRGGAR